MRRKSSPFFLLLFEVLILCLLPCSESSSIPFPLSIRQHETSAPDFNVVATDEGVPVLEPGENPAKDPQVIQDTSVPTNTPDQNVLPEITSSQTNPPKPQSPSKTKVSNPSKEPANDAEEREDIFEDVNPETSDDDGPFDPEPSSEFEEEEEDIPPAGPTNKQPVSGNTEEDVLLHPEPSTIPDYPPSSKGSSPGKPSSFADPKPSASDKPTKRKPVDGDSSTGKDNDNDHDHDQELEPSRELDPETVSLPEATSFDASTSPTLPPTVVTPTSQPDVPTPAKPTRSDAPELGGTETKPTTQGSPANTVSNPQGKDDSVDPLSEGFVQPDATYRCVNFAARKFGDYELFDERATDGSLTFYKGSGVALNPTLPMPYRYHVYGKNWTYHLNVTSDLNQNIILGFAEVFPKACASGRNGSFRVFTVSVGGDFEIVDVMKSSGCGTLQQAVFQNIKPKEQVIDLNFDAISGKAMLSVVCYGASAHVIPEGAPAKSPKVGNSESGKSSGSSAGHTSEVNKQCFTFGEPRVSGFTSIGIPDLDSGLEIYKDESASVDNTDSPDVYKSHIFGSDFTLSIALGVTHSVTVQLGFAEIFEPGCMPGSRVFTVKAGPEFRTIDVFEEVGCGSVFTLELPNILPNTNGEIDIAFSSVSNFAMVSSACIVDKDKAKGSQGLGKRSSLAISSGPKESAGSELAGEEINSGTDSDTEPLLPSLEEFPQQSFEAEQEEDDVEDFPEQSFEAEQEDDDDDDIELKLPKSSPYPKENGILVVADPPNKSPDKREHPTESPLPKVNGLIDATLTNSPSPSGDPEGDTGANSNSSTETGDRAPMPSDELLPSDFSQTTIGEEADGKDQVPSPDLLVSPSEQSSGSDSASHGASGIEDAPLAPSATAEVPGPGSQTADVPVQILPTKTPVPVSDASVSDDGGANGVVDKQGDITIEAPSPSPSVLTVAIEASTPSVSPVGVAIEGPSSPSSEENVTIIGPESEATSTPTPSSISAAAFSPIPSAGEATASPSIPGTASQPSNITPKPVVTVAVPNTASIEPTAALSPSPLGTPTSTGDDVAPSPPGSRPTGITSPQPPTPSGVPDGNVILPPVATSPGPQGDPDGSSGGDGAFTSPPPVATISQNQIIVVPSASPAEAPISASSSPLPQTSNSPDPIGIIPGIGAPDGDIAGSPAPDSSAANPGGSPIPDIVTNPSVTGASSPQATPSPPQTTSSVGSSEVIVDSTTIEPSPSPLVSTSIGAPDDGPVQVTDNSTEIIEVTGDVGADGSETEKQPSILVGEYKDIIATTPAGSGFAIGMGILGSLLVLLLLVCLFFAIFRGGGAAYSYSSGYSSHKPTDYDPSQGRYTDDLVLDPAGYRNVPSRGQSAQDGYGTEPVTFESRQEGQSESFGFEMPAAGGLGAPTEEARNDDTLADYSSSHLQQASAQDEPVPELTTNGSTRGAGAGHGESGPYQFTDVQNSYMERNPNASYGSIPDEYTFTGTFTIPRTEFRPSQGESAERQVDRISQGSEQYLQSKAMTRDSFNDDHSIARPTNASESSGKQERDFREASRITQESVITKIEAPANVAPSSRDDTLVDDVRSSLLDSEYESTASLFSLRSNPTTAPSPYETHQFIKEDIASDSARIIPRNHTFSDEPRGIPQTSQRQLQPMTDPYQERIPPTFPQYQTKQKTEGVGETRFTPTEAAGQSLRQTTSNSNDGPWPSWWAREDQKYEPPSGYTTRENGKLEMDGVETRQGVDKKESNGPLTPRNSRTHRTTLPSELTNTSSGPQGTFVPDSKWRRQYSSTSDEDESQAEADPYLEDLRRRRQPYVRSVANRLSTGSGSLLMTGSGKFAFENGISLFQVADMSSDGLGPTREISPWISRDPVPV